MPIWGKSDNFHIYALNSVYQYLWKGKKGQFFYCLYFQGRYRGKTCHNKISGNPRGSTQYWGSKRGPETDKSGPLVAICGFTKLFIWCSKDLMGGLQNDLGQPWLQPFNPILQPWQVLLNRAELKLRVAIFQLLSQAESIGLGLQVALGLGYLCNRWSFDLGLIGFWVYCRDWSVLVWTIC